MTLETTDSDPTAPTPETPSPDFEWSDKLALERIEAITRNARATWFGLLGLLAFVMVTLLGVEDIDFFGYDRDTALPLVGVAVPTITFFVAAPILTAAVYAYFHFYLMKLWDALGRAPARVFSDPIGGLIHPWLLSDAALVLRDNLQIRDDDKAIRQKRLADEGAAAIRPLHWVSALTSAALTWAAGWVTLGYAWMISWPAHEEWLSLLIFGCFFFTLWVGGASLWTIWVRVGRRDFAPEAAKFWRGRFQSADFTGATGVTQAMLKDAVGDGDTILPVADGKPLYVWSCWEEPPATFDRLLGHYHESLHDDLRAEWICGPEGRGKTGRTAEP